MKKYIGLDIIEIEYIGHSEYIKVFSNGGSKPMSIKHLNEFYDELKPHCCKELSILDLNESQYKLYEEYRELMIKIALLIEKLDLIEWADNLLVSQFNYMCGYQLTLVKRINKF